MTHGNFQGHKPKLLILFRRAGLYFRYDSFTKPFVMLAKWQSPFITKGQWGQCYTRKQKIKLDMQCKTYTNYLLPTYFSLLIPTHLSKNMGLCLLKLLFGLTVQPYLTLCQKLSILCFILSVELGSLCLLTLRRCCRASTSGWWEVCGISLSIIVKLPVVLTKINSF